MVSNDDFDGKATNLNYFYLHINFEQKYLKPAIVSSQIVCYTTNSRCISTGVIISIKYQGVDENNRQF